MFSRMKINCRLRMSEIPSLLYSTQSPDVFAQRTYSKVFFDATVQDLLTKLTRIDLNKVFRPKGPRKGKMRKYELMTTEQLQEKMRNAEKKAQYLMQIPPLITPKVTKVNILHEDPGLDGHDIHHSKLVCTDISHNVPNQRRTIVVREPNGALRNASDDEKFRMNQIYFPTPGRELELPKMFESENLKSLIDREEYEFILDRACAQFEPEDPRFHDVLEPTFEKINEKSRFGKLLSTRHYGCLVFYLVSHKKIDNLLYVAIRCNRIEDAYNLVKLYYIVHPDSNSVKLSAGDNQMDLLNNYINADATNKTTLKSAVKDYLNELEKNKNLESGIREAHGLR